MSSHFRWYPSESEVIVPFNARYSFPSQANKAVKMTPRIPPKNGGTFNPGSVVRLEFPAQGYVNPNNTTLSFDVTIKNPMPLVADKSQSIRFQNNIQSIFSRVRLLYGATPIEDIIGYNQIVRSITEWTGASTENTICQTSINEGIGGYVMGRSGSLSDVDADRVTVATRNASLPGLVPVRQAYIHGVSTHISANSAASQTSPVGAGFGTVPAGTAAVSPAIGTGATQAFLLTTTEPVKRYTVQFALGLFNQPKLIPTKFMASQLSIEITLANPSECMIATSASSANTVNDSDSIAGVADSGANVLTTTSYQLTNINLIPEILEFDASYDEMFLKGLMNGGVPIKFSTWNNYKSTSASTSVNIQIQERGRSVKSIFALQRRDPTNFGTDSGASFFCTSTTGTAGSNTLQEYQYRIGGRYFPASPVQNATVVGGAVSNGGGESWIELSKALNTLGDARLATPCNVLKWAVPPMSITWNAAATVFTTLPEFDYRYQVVRWSNGSPIVFPVEGFFADGATTQGNAFCGNQGSSCFAMAIDLETSNGGEISGLNAEEQSDITLIARWNNSQQSGMVFDIYTYIDSMIVLRENNVIILLTLGFGTNSVNCVNIIKMDPNIEYLELAIDNWDSTAAGGQVWTNGPGNNQLQYSWPKFYWTEKSPDIIAFKLVSAEVPNIFDTVSRGSNTFLITVAGAPTTITIPDGIYTGTTLATQLTTLLAAYPITVTYNTVTLRLDFVYGVANAWSLFFADRNTAYSVLGFLPGSTTSLAGAGTISSAIIPNVTGPYYLYLNSRTMGSLINFNLADGSPDSVGTPQIGRVPVNVNKGDVIFYTDPTPDNFFDFFAGPKFEVFDLYWTLGSDQEQRPLDMKGVPWSVKFAFLAYRQATSDLRVKPAKRAANMLS